jgi:4-amino-4-deoxy-L-arabinose transferase-like glycosyltransferase
MNIRKDKYIYLIIFTALILYIPLSLFRDFTPVNELKYINIVDHMLKSGDWIKLQFDGALYTDKPPLYFWLTALIRIITGKYTLFSISFFICILPAIVMGIDIYRFLGENNYTKKRAYTVVLILYTILYFAGSVLVIRMDILMSMFIIKALISFYNITEKKRGRAELPYIYMGTGFLVKGLAAVFIPLGVILIYLFVTKQREKIKDLRLGRGIVIIIIFALIWLIPLAVNLGIHSVINELLLKQTMNRAVNTSVHKRPVYYYLINLVPNLFPWTLFFFVSFITLLIKIKKQSNFVIFILCWFLVPLIIFSLVSSKLDIYLIPAYGAIAVIAEKILSESRDRVRTVTGITSSLFYLLFIIAAFAAKKKLVEMDPLLFRLVLVYGIFSLVTAVSGIYFILKGKTDRYVYNIVINTAVLLTVLTVSTPVLNEYIGFTKFAEIIKTEKEKNKSLEVLGFKENEVNRMAYIIDDYNIRNIESAESIKQIINKADIVILLRNKDIKELPENYEMIYSNNKFSIIKYIRKEG